MPDTMVSPRGKLDAPGTVLAGRARSLISALVDELFGDGAFTAILPEASCTSLFAAVWRPRAAIHLVPPDPMTGVALADAYLSCAMAVGSPGLALVTDAFGFRVGALPLTQALAGRGWRVLQNDPCGLRLAEKPLDGTLGTVCSFGPGKVVDAGAGGAFFASDPALAKRLRARVAGYPPLDAQAMRVEDYLVRLRRALWYGHPSGRSLLGRWQGFLAEEQMELRHSLPADRRPALASAVAGAPRERRERARRAELWVRLLSMEQAEGLHVPTVRPTSWWRCNVLLDHRRQEAIDLLSAMNMPAGRLYPSLAHYFPDLTGGAPSPVCEGWSARVLNLPVASTITEAAIHDAAAALSNLLRG